MNYEKLTSHKVNYLIWRYLQEAGFGQAALRLERDWGLQHHPDDLPFAKHIGPRGLIVLLQYGLKLHRIQALERPNQPRFFGPDHSATAVNIVTDAQQPPPPLQPQPTRTKSSSPSRNADATLSAPLSSTKPRSRKPNGAIAAAAGGKPKSTAAASESMDVDQSPGVTNDNAVTTKSEHHMDIDDEGSDHNKIADETFSSVSSPARNGEQSSATNGIEIQSQRPTQEQQSVPVSVFTPTLINTGTQVDDIIELAPKTRILSTKSIKNSTLTHVSLSPSRQTTSQSLLAIGGNQLGQIWDIAKDAFLGQATPVVATQDFKPIDLVVDPGSSLTSLAWNPDGDQLAYSTYSNIATGNQRSVMQIWSSVGDNAGDTYGSIGEAVTDLAWDPTGRYIAGLSSTSVLLFDTKTASTLTPLDTGYILFDIDWVDRDTLVVCGNSYVALATVNGTGLDLKPKFSDLAESVEWTKLRYDTSTNSIAVASESSGQIAIIESSGKAHQETAHTSSLSDMVDCPMPSDEKGSRILATSSIEGDVKIWRFDSQITLVQRLEMGGVSHALTLSFNPSGSLLAVADCDKVLFWDTHGGVQPKFKWELRRVDWPAVQVNGHAVNGVNGHDHEISMEDTFELTPVLIWEDSGHSLIFAHKEKIAIIDTPA